MEYPKIETVFERDPVTFKVRPGELRLPEFDLVSRWHVTEKIDGMNIRLRLAPDGRVTYAGRTDAAQLSATFFAWLQDQFPAAIVAGAFDPETAAIVFGEGYGPKIQKGGGNYRATPGFRVFDVAILTPARVWWLPWEGVESVARKLGALTPVELGTRLTLAEATALAVGPSLVAEQDGGPGCQREGIVARTEPPLFTRTGARVLWKLKGRDLPDGRGDVLSG